MKKKKSNSIEEDILNNKNKPVEEENIEIDVVKSKTGNGFFRKKFVDKFDDLKIKYKKDPKKFVVVATGLLLAFSTLVGSSYAYLTYVSKTANSTTINAGTLAMVFKNESNSITLNNALPQKDSDGLANSSEYQFTIENTGSIPAQFKVTLDNTCAQGKSYTVGGTSINADKCIPNEYIKVGLKEGNGNYKVLDYKTSNKDNSYVLDAGNLSAKSTKTYKLKVWLDYDTPNDYNSKGVLNVIYSAKLGLSYEQGTNLDTSGANTPDLSDNMIPVYYDETSETWKKADSTNQNVRYQWYNYDDKMWANSVTVSSTNRSTYLNADPGTTIPMDDILTMQVWIPRYKYKVWNYNADGTVASEPQEIEITFEKETATTGEISCTDSISGTDGAASETCKLKSTSATCTDATCNGKTYTHPAFTFGTQELKGMWVGKFENSAPTDSTCYTSESKANCNITGITPLVKPDVKSYRYAQISTFETNIMAMNDSGNIYGFTGADDTHMMKNQEWGAVAYLSHSKYGTCTDGTCTEININNSSGFYTGRSGGNVGGQTPINVTYTDQTSTTQYNTYGFYTYDGYLLNYGTNTKSSTKDMTKIASTTGNIYGIYDMSGGADEYVMGNIVSSDATTMMSGDDTTYNSGYTGILYESGTYTSYTGIAYPENKYLDKYSFGTNFTQKKRSKLGDAVKEVTATSSTGWYSDYGYVASASRPWFARGGNYGNGSSAGVLDSDFDNGYAGSRSSARVVVFVP